MKVTSSENHTHPVQFWRFQETQIHKAHSPVKIECFYHTKRFPQKSKVTVGRCVFQTMVYSSGWLQRLELCQAKARRFIWVFDKDDRDPKTWATFCCIARPSSGSWITNGMIWTDIGTQMGCSPCRQLLYTHCHNTSFYRENLRSATHTWPFRK